MLTEIQSYASMSLSETGRGVVNPSHLSYDNSSFGQSFKGPIMTARIEETEGKAPSKGKRRAQGHFVVAPRKGGSQASRVHSQTGGLIYVRIDKPEALYRANPLERIALIKKGIKASAVAATAKMLHMKQERLTETLGMPRATVARKTKNNEDLSTDQTERLVGVVRLVGQVKDMVADDRFDAGEWVSKWLETSIPALGGRKPAEFMDTSEGQQLVARTLAQVESGAYG